MVSIKICGTTSVADARLAAEAGADFLGIIVEHPPSPRSVPLERAVEIAGAVKLPVAAVTVNLPVERLRDLHAALAVANGDVRLQLHGDEPAEVVRELKDAGIAIWVVASGDAESVRARAATMHAAGADAILLDAREIRPDGIVYGGTGKAADWNVARELVEKGYRVILAGGLDPENVERAIQAVRPWAVDTVSGVEATKGQKDPAKVQAFINAAHGAATKEYQQRVPEPIARLLLRF